MGIKNYSPFINLWLEDDDYIKLLQNLRHYLYYDLEFTGKYGVDTNSRLPYPIMSLGDILIHCNHDHYPKDAIEKWNRRKQRLNYKNIFVEMFTENKEISEKFSRLNQYSKKICFVPFSTKEYALFQLHSLDSEEIPFWEKVLKSATIENNSLSYRILDLLNGKKL